MKVPPKRKGNYALFGGHLKKFTLNESPSEKEGKYHHSPPTRQQCDPLNESPSEKEGKYAQLSVHHLLRGDPQ